MRLGIIFFCLFVFFLVFCKNEKFVLKVIFLFFSGSVGIFCFGLWEILGIFLKLIR